MQNPSEKQVYLLADISSMLYDSTKLKNVRKYATMTTKMVFHGSDIEKICSYYHLNKEERIAYHTSACTHAMTFTGVNLDANEKPNRWKVENSWGKDNGLDGYYVMSDAWFDEYVMWVFVRKSLLPQDLLDKYNASSIIPEGPNNTIFQKLD